MWKDTVIFSEMSKNYPGTLENVKLNAFGIIFSELNKLHFPSTILSF